MVTRFNYLGNFISNGEKVDNKISQGINKIN